ncbi:MAG: hypothetical protein Greene041619_7 [Candidatus Peregrinibacteria bacterium Greene0416_19]|nr:MAG: hypothetical protein Greene041619_7 [Candidatus Peregrinibacteria bacterium Greene0416_19]
MSLASPEERTLRVRFFAKGKPEGKMHYHTVFPSCNRFASVRRYAVETFIVRYSPVRGSKTRFFWMFALKVRRVCRIEWLRVFPNAVPLPVLTQRLAIGPRAYRG